MYEQDQARGHEKASCEAQEVRRNGETAAARIWEPAASLAGCGPALCSSKNCPAMLLLFVCHMSGEKAVMWHMLLSGAKNNGERK